MSNFTGKGKALECVFKFLRLPFMVMRREKEKNIKKCVSDKRKEEEEENRDHINFVCCCILFIYFIFNYNGNSKRRQFLCFPLGITVILSIFRGYLGDLIFLPLASSSD